MCALYSHERKGSTPKLSQISLSANTRTGVLSWCSVKFEMQRNGEAVERCLQVLR